jgi:hypothetical protein
MKQMKEVGGGREVALDALLLFNMLMLVHFNILCVTFWLVGYATAAAVRRTRRVSVGGGDSE